MYDPTIYRGSAPYYARGRPPYSRALGPTLAEELRLDGSGRLLDVGCGPGVLAIQLASYFAEVVGLDADADMLREAAKSAAAAHITHARWVHAVAEAIPDLELGSFNLVTFGQSFQWTDRLLVASAVYEALRPDGTIALIFHTVDGRPQPRGPGLPAIPHDAINGLIDRYLGPRRRAGQGLRAEPGEPYSDTLTRAGFRNVRVLFAPGEPNVVKDADAVIANCFSTSFAAPHLFGHRRDAFEAEMRTLLVAHSPGGKFWDWPGDTEIVLAQR